MQVNMKTKSIMLCLLFSALSLKYNLCSGGDAISGNQSLSGDQTITSKQGTFELGFFTKGNSSNFYIGIWYKNVSVQTIVWVANREAPVKDRYSSTLIIQGANLVLFNESQDPIWSTGVDSISSGGVLAVLRDNGNFFLTEGSSNSAFWQSFDHPTDTWLPGGKLFYNKGTNGSQGFISWRNSEDPAPGRFALEFDGNGNQYVITGNRTRQYWATGKWSDQRRDFECVPELRYTSFYNFSFVDTENETYFAYDLISHDLISRLVMDVSGQVKSNLWSEENKQRKIVWSQPVQQCRVFSQNGATVKMLDECREDAFVKCVLKLEFEFL